MSRERERAKRKKNERAEREQVKREIVKRELGEKSGDRAERERREILCLLIYIRKKQN